MKSFLELLAESKAPLQKEHCTLLPSHLYASKLRNRQVFVRKLRRDYMVNSKRRHSLLFFHANSHCYFASNIRKRLLECFLALTNECTTNDPNGPSIHFSYRELKVWLSTLILVELYCIYFFALLCFILLKAKLGDLLIIFFPYYFCINCSKRCRVA